MDHRKRQGLRVTFHDTKKQVMDKGKEEGPVPEFVVSTGWFYKFKARHAFRSVKRSGEAKSADADAAAAVPDELCTIIKEEWYKPQ